MAYAFRLEQFEGPLDLLLELIEEQKMDITAVSLATVAEQFLQYLENTDGLHPEEMADFLVVAAKLLLIKSRALIPTLAVDDDDGIDLEQQLKMYRLYYDAAKRLEKMIVTRQYSFSRTAPLKIGGVERTFRPPQHVGAEQIHQLFLGTLKRLEPFVHLPEETLVRTINLRERLDSIRDRIFREASIQFHTLIAEAETRTDIIVTFLALLELVKQRTIQVVQDDMFSPITIQALVLEETQPGAIATL